MECHGIYRRCYRCTCIQPTIGGNDFTQTCPRFAFSVVCSPSTFILPVAQRQSILICHESCIFQCSCNIFYTRRCICPRFSICNRNIYRNGYKVIAYIYMIIHMVCCGFRLFCNGYLRMQHTPLNNRHLTHIPCCTVVCRPIFIALPIANGYQRIYIVIQQTSITQCGYYLILADHICIGCICIACCAHYACNRIYSVITQIQIIGYNFFHSRRFRLFFCDGNIRIQYAAIYNRFTQVITIFFRQVAAVPCSLTIPAIYCNTGISYDREQCQNFSICWNCTFIIAVYCHLFFNRCNIPIIPYVIGNRHRFRCSCFRSYICKQYASSCSRVVHTCIMVFFASIAAFPCTLTIPAIHMNNCIFCNAKCISDGFFRRSSLCISGAFFYGLYKGFCFVLILHIVSRRNIGYFRICWIFWSCCIFPCCLQGDCSDHSVTTHINNSCQRLWCCISSAIQTCHHPARKGFAFLSGITHFFQPVRQRIYCRPLWNRIQGIVFRIVNRNSNQFCYKQCRFQRIAICRYCRCAQIIWIIATTQPAGFIYCKNNHIYGRNRFCPIATIYQRLIDCLFIRTVHIRYQFCYLCSLIFSRFLQRSQYNIRCICQLERYSIGGINTGYQNFQYTLAAYQIQAIICRIDPILIT